MPFFAVNADFFPQKYGAAKKLAWVGEFFHSPFFIASKRLLNLFGNCDIIFYNI